MSATPGRGAPIGVFDSGVGGLTVARALQRRVPHEALLYVGDTARVPYGPKSPVTVQRYALQIGEWLVEQGVKCVVVACNTATAYALPLLEQVLPVPVVGVIGPGARAAIRLAQQGPVGIIGTVGTIASGAYPRAIAELAPHLEVHGEACPLFVPLVEEGWTDREATRLIVREYLEGIRRVGANPVVLGCTHYPLLRNVIAAELGDGVHLIDSAEETAATVEAVLLERNLLRVAGAVGAAPPRHRFVASDAPGHFLALGSRFFGASLGHVEHHVFT